MNHLQSYSLTFLILLLGETKIQTGRFVFFFFFKHRSVIYCFMITYLHSSFLFKKKKNYSAHPNQKPTYLYYIHIILERMEKNICLYIIICIQYCQKQAKNRCFLYKIIFYVCIINILFSVTKFLSLVIMYYLSTFICFLNGL